MKVRSGVAHSLVLYRIHKPKRSETLSKKPLKTIVQQIAEPIVEELGYELVDVEYKNPGGPWKLIIYIYKDSGINFEDCELVSKTLDPIFDSNENIAERYDFLQISSPGLDREFKSIKDYKRYIGRKVEISLYAHKNGKKKITGILKNADGDSIVIEDNDIQLELKLDEIGKAVLAIEF